MKEYRFNLNLTQKCNLRCPHCYNSNKKGSLTREQVDTIIGNLEDNLIRLKIEGGEVYCERELFYYTLRRFRDRFGKSFHLGVNTNGVAFYQSRDNVLQEADKLYNLGVNKIRISLDKFHEDGGADLEKVRSIKRFLDEVHHPLDVGYLSLTVAMPIGEAEKLLEHQKEKRDCMNGPDCLDNPYFFTDILGNLYTCCWRLVPPIGNILTARLGDIYKGMSKSDRKILAGEIKPFASTPQLQRILSEEGECRLCKEAFKDARPKIDL
ncbi:MAG: radical SAM protein [archaeon]|jgi:organic radical activating enzyme|nr:radical SAM protein [archaeon]